MITYEYYCAWCGVLLCRPPRFEPSLETKVVHSHGICCSCLVAVFGGRIAALVHVSFASAGEPVGDADAESVESVQVEVRS